jgi:hypothetical protein
MPSNPCNPARPTTLDTDAPAIMLDTELSPAM